MRKDIDAFEVKARGQYIYQQYQSAEWLKKYGKFIDEYIQYNYFTQLRKMWDTIDVAESMHEYLTFYTKHYFGLFRPLAGASISDYYDIGLNYDDGRIYDDAQDANGLVTGEQYLKYIKFIYDYTTEIWHLDFVLNFIATYCGINPNEITIDFSFKNEVRLKIPATEQTQEFVKLIINYYDEMCLPFPNVLNFLIKSESDKTKPQLIYSPYTKIFNMYPNTSTPQTFADAQKQNVVYDGDTLAENRTFLCLQRDKSQDLQNPLPLNLQNNLYWKLLSYAINDIIYIAEDSTISSEVNRSIADGASPLYTKGWYQCKQEDLDIDKSGLVATYEKIDKVNTPTDKQTPASFKRYIDKNNTRIAIWTKKWNKLRNDGTILIKPATPTSQSPILATYNQQIEVNIGNIQPNATLNIKNVNTSKANVELKAGTNDTLLYTAITQDRTYHYVELTQTLNNETSDKLTIEFKLNGA